MTRIRPRDFDPSTGIQKPSKAPKKPRKGMPARSKKRVDYWKTPRGQFDLMYMGLVRQLPCWICQEFGMVQTSHTTAHHPIHGRYSTSKSDNIKVICICDGHHQARFDKSKLALHNEPTQWKRLFGEDHEYIERTQDLVEKTFGVRVEDRPEPYQ